MSTRISEKLTYDAPISEVSAMHGDPAFWQEVCDAQRVVSSEVSVEPGGPGAKRIVVVQEHATSGLPSFARKVAGDGITIRQEERWDDDHRADVRFTIPGKPGEVTGSAGLTESGGTTTHAVDATISIPIPFVGGKVEGLVADILVRALQAEQRVGRDYLSR